MGKEEADSDTLLGYAFDGFPIYGPLSESSKLDECNGRTKNGKYMYHVVVSPYFYRIHLAIVFVYLC